MANISTYLQKILSAIYGEEVRGSIHDALSAMNTEASKAMEYAATARDSATASASSAKTSALTATQKASEATASAGAAKTSETNAKVSETNAANKASEAAASNAAAKASERNAANSEAIATQKASAASASESAAAQSAAEALATESRTKIIKSEIEVLDAKVAANKIASEAAKEAAENARNFAASSETNVQASANAAFIAKAAAEVAKTDAESAKSDAISAKNAAEKAKTDAESAKVDAETARDNAANSETNAAASAASAQQYSGKPPKPQGGTWWIWDASTQMYVDSKISCELVGPVGVGVSDIKLTTGDHTPGTTDIYTVTLTDKSTYNISVYNGRNGTGSGDILGIFFDLVIPASGWQNGEITIADNRLLASATHKYFLGADETSRDEFLKCGVQPKDITTTGFITFNNDTDPMMDLTVNLIRLEMSANGTS